MAVEVVDAVSFHLVPTVCVALGLRTTLETVEGVAISIVLATTIWRSAVMGETEAIAKTVAIVGLILVIVVALLSGGDSSDECNASSGEFHFVLNISLYFLVILQKSY